MKRPHVICHMTVSIDGKVTGDFLGRDECVAATEIYYMLNRDYIAEAFGCGRVTMEESFTGGWFPDLDDFKDKKVAHVDYIADANAERYAIAFDRKGNLGWKVSHLEDADPGYDKCHIVEVLTDEVDDAYLAYLTSVRIVHGKGTGALRAGVHNYLRRQKHVSSFRLGSFGEGDAGVTIAEFK